MKPKTTQVSVQIGQAQLQISNFQKDPMHDQFYNFTLVYTEGVLVSVTLTCTATREAGKDQQPPIYTLTPLAQADLTLKIAQYLAVDRQLIGQYPDEFLASLRTTLKRIQSLQTTRMTPLEVLSLTLGSLLTIVLEQTLNEYFTEHSVKPH